MRSNFGQLMSLLNTVNMVGYNTAQAVVKTQAIKGQASIEKKSKELQYEEKQAELKLRDRDYALKARAGERQEKLFKDIAIIVGIGIVAVMSIIGIGVLVSKKKGKAQ